MKAGPRAGRQRPKITRWVSHQRKSHFPPCTPHPLFPGKFQSPLEEWQCYRKAHGFAASWTSRVKVTALYSQWVPRVHTLLNRHRMHTSKCVLAPDPHTQMQKGLSADHEGVEKSQGWFRHINSKSVSSTRKAATLKKLFLSNPDNIIFNRWRKVKPGLLRKKTTLRNQNQTAMPGLAAPEREDPNLGRAARCADPPDTTKRSDFPILHPVQLCGLCSSYHSTTKLKSNFLLKFWVFFVFCFFRLRLHSEVREWDIRNSQTHTHSIQKHSTLHIPILNCPEAQMVYSLNRLRLASISGIWLTTFSWNRGISCNKLINTGENGAP